MSDWSSNYVVDLEAPNCMKRLKRTMCAGVSNHLKMAQGSAVRVDRRFKRRSICTPKPRKDLGKFGNVTPGGFFAPFGDCTQRFRRVVVCTCGGFIKNPDLTVISGPWVDNASAAACSSGASFDCECTREGAPNLPEIRDCSFGFIAYFPSRLLRCCALDVQHPFADLGSPPAKASVDTIH